MASIEVTPEIKKILDEMKSKGESYNDLIEKMIEDELGLNKRTIKEIEKSKKSQSFTHKEIKKRFKL